MANKDIKVIPLNCIPRSVPNIPMEEILRERKKKRDYLVQTWKEKYNKYKK